MKKNFNFIIIAIIALCVVGASIFTGCNSTPDGDPQGTPPAGEVWVYSSLDLQKQAVKNDINKIVLKSNGNFTESVEIVGAKNKTIVGENGVDFAGITLQATENIIIDNIAFSKASLVLRGGDEITIKNCKFTEKGRIQNYVYRRSAEGAENLRQYNKVQNLTIEGCTFRNFNDTTIGSGWNKKGVIALRVFNNVTIKNNNFDNLSTAAICLGEDLANEDQRITEGNIVIEGNTFGKSIAERQIIVYEAGKGNGRDEPAPARSCTISGNTFYDNLTSSNEFNVYVEVEETIIGVNTWEISLEQIEPAIYAPYGYTIDLDKQVEMDN